MKTPRYITRTITAGNTSPVGVAGHHIAIAAISASTVLLAIDDETPQQVIQGLQIRVPTGFQRVTLVNTGGVASTVQLYVSDEEIDLITNAILTLIAASLVNIDTDLEHLKAGTTKTGTRSGAIAQTGVGTTAILAANANRKSGFVQADSDNAGRVWLGTTNAVTQATSWFELLPGATSPELHDTIAVWACSENGTELVRYYETT
jgi:hypothetical protein